MFEHFKNHFISLFISSSVVATILSTLFSIFINYIVFKKKEKNLRLKEFKKICQKYEDKSLIMHQDCRERVIKNDGTDTCNIINVSRVGDLRKEIQDDVELNVYCEEFKINKDNLNTLLYKYGEFNSDQIYVILDSIRKEFLKIQKELSA